MLPDDVRERLAALGIDLEESTRALLAEVRERVPPRLVANLLGKQTPHGVYGYRYGLCRCDVCVEAHRADRRDYYARTLKR